jgi:hypothetical protein
MSELEIVTSQSRAAISPGEFRDPYVPDTRSETVSGGPYEVTGTIASVLSRFKGLRDTVVHASTAYWRETATPLASVLSPGIAESVSRVVANWQSFVEEPYARSRTSDQAVLSVVMATSIYRIAQLVIKSAAQSALPAAARQWRDNPLLLLDPVPYRTPAGVRLLCYVHADSPSYESLWDTGDYNFDPESAESHSDLIDELARAGSPSATDAIEEALVSCGASVVPALEHFLEQEERAPGSRACALRVISALVPNRAVDLALKAATDPRAPLREVAAEIMGDQLWDARVRSVLEHMKRYDPSELVRHAAEDALRED